MQRPIVQICLGATFLFGILFFVFYSTGFLGLFKMDGSKVRGVGRLCKVSSSSR